MIAMLNKLLNTIYYFKNRDYIPPTPKAYKTKYSTDDVTEEQWRVLRRLGARSPHGIKQALEKHNCSSVDELIEHLQHYTPQRRVKRRLWLALGRMVGGMPYDPNQSDYQKAFRKSRRAKELTEIRRRQEHNRRLFNHDG
jgi:hypothetical protein